LIAYTSLAAPDYARAHPHLPAALLAEYAAPWPVALGSAFALLGAVVALIPVRRHERWACWSSFATMMILFLVRMTTDPRCLVVLDPHQHGCHTFMIAMALGLTGVAMAAFAR
jgi:hypothetical protein